MTDKIIRCRDCKHWKIDNDFAPNSPKGYNPIDKDTGIMKHWIDGICDISMGNMVDIDIDCGDYGGFRRVRIVTNNNFFCAAAEDK